jgi:hypothetical protein
LIDSSLIDTDLVDSGGGVSQWADPWLVYPVATVAVGLLVVTIWLFRRAKRDGRAAGAICLALSVALHLALLAWVPFETPPQGGSANQDEAENSVGADSVMFSTFDPELDVADAAGQHSVSPLKPLPVAELENIVESESDETSAEVNTPPENPDPVPESLAEIDPPAEVLEGLDESLQSAIDELLQSAVQADDPELSVSESAQSSETPTNTDSQMVQAEVNETGRETDLETNAVAASQQAEAAFVPGDKRADFANRVGAAKEKALLQTGGSMKTEAAVRAALRFLADAQRNDGAWDPSASGAGIERKPLGEHRFGAGTKSETGLTGLALLAMMGAGNTHLRGEYSENVFKGLAYLIRHQRANGSLQGEATLYAASYCHSMAALAMCEAAVMTGDASAVESSRRAIRYTLQMQHPVTGGWRYTKGDPGDLSQLGWQAMVLDGGRRAGIEIDEERFRGIGRFLSSVRGGRGGLARYRPGEATSRTMTAEALATRLLIGQQVADVEIREAERYLLEEVPGNRQDNYYYWYYATLALHQLQDEAWQRWNESLKARLLATQRPDGSWPSSTVWGGYGGTVYTTAMATLCLETYYRHALRDSISRIARQP